MILFLFGYVFSTFSFFVIAYILNLYKLLNTIDLF